MFLPNDTFDEINKILIPPSPINLIDKEDVLKNMDSFYELEDFIKENIYDKKYPGVLPDIDTNMISRGESSDEEEQNQEKEPSQDNNSQKILPDISKNIQEKKYKISSTPTDIVSFSGNFSTDDEDEYNAIKLLNENREEGNEHGWTLSVDKGHIKIYYKIVKLQDEQGKDVDSLFFYVDATLDYPSNIINKYVNDFNFRKEFDEMYKQAKIIEEKNDEENNVRIIDGYYYMKMPFMFTDRDFVTRKKIWSEHDNKKGCYLINIKSIEHPDYPAKDKPVRGKFINRSAYICPDGDDKCKFYLGTCFDMKLNVSVSMMKNKGSEGQGKWVEELIKNIKKHEG